MKRWWRRKNLRKVFVSVLLIIFWLQQSLLVPAFAQESAEIVAEELNEPGAEEVSSEISSDQDETSSEMLIPTPTRTDLPIPQKGKIKPNRPRLLKEGFKTGEPISASLGDYKKEEIVAKVFNANGQEMDLKTDVEDKVLKVLPSSKLRPGKYSIKVQDNATNDIVLEQSFTWGVLAINTNKSTFLPNEKVYLQMAALDDNGHTLCNARLKLEITDPESKTVTFSSDDASIKSSETCGADNVTDNPDYYAFFQTDGAGDYKLRLTNLDNDYEVEDAFSVKEKIAFEIERIGATRINPFKANYQVVIKAKANQDFEGIVKEQLPSGFKVTPREGMEVVDLIDRVEIIWSIKINSGDEINFQYEYDAPEISPQFYLLGPLKFSEKNTPKYLFSESRQWQVAADSAETDSIMVYDTQTTTSTPKYRRWTGSSWGAETSANDVDGVIKHQVLKFCPTRDEAILIVLTSTGKLQAQVWNGSSWGDVSTLTTMSQSNDLYSQYRYFDIEYESTSGDAVVVYDDGTADPNYVVWNGSGWSDETNINIPTSGLPYWIEMAADPNSNEMAMISIDASNDVYGMYWDGSTWGNMGTSATWDASGASGAYKSIDVAFERNSGDALFIWGSATATDQYYRTYDGTTLSSNTLLDISGENAAVLWVKLASDPTAGSDNIMYGAQTNSSSNEIHTAFWNGSAWSSLTEHDSANEDRYDMNFDIVFETAAANAGDAWLVWGDGATVSTRLWDGGTSAWAAIGSPTVDDDTATIQLSAQPNSGALLAVVYEDDTSASDDIKQMNLTGGGQTWSALSQIWDGPVATNRGYFRVDVASERYNSSNNAMMVYDIAAIVTTPKYREWTGSWGAEQNMNDIDGEVRHQVLRFAPTRDEAIWAAVTSTGDFVVEVWDGDSWGSATTLFTLPESTDLISQYKCFDLQYETTSGDAIIVYTDGTADPNYQVWNGSSWSGSPGTNINIPTAGIVYLLEMGADPTGDEMLMMTVNSAYDVYGMHWSGSAWDNMGVSAAWDSNAANVFRKHIEIAYENTSGDGMLFWGGATNGVYWYRTYSDSTLSSSQILIIEDSGGVPNWTKIKSDTTTGSNKLMLGVEDSVTNINTRLWDGSSWDTFHSTPKYQVWNGSAWGGEQSANDIDGEIGFQILKFCPTRNEAILAVLTTEGKLQTQVWNGSSWGSATTLQTGIDPRYRGFDIEYETTSGDAIIVYTDGTADPDYKVWNGSGWSESGTDIDLATTGVPYWIEMASDPTSDDLAIITLDANTDVYGMYWNGSSWDDMNSGGVEGIWDAAASVATRKAIDVAFEDTSGDVMFAWGFATVATAHFRYRTYSGSTFSSVTNVTNANNGGVVHWLKLAANPASDSNQIMIGLLDAGSDLNTFLWDGTAWGAVDTEHSAATEDIVDMNFDIVFETAAANAGDAWLVYGDGATVTSKLWNGSSWGAATTRGDDTANVQLSAQPNSGKLFTLMYEDDGSASDDIKAMNMDPAGVGQTWGSQTTIWGGPVNTNMGFFRVDVASERYNSSNNAMMVYDTNTSDIPHPEHDAAAEDAASLNFGLIFETHSQNAGDCWLFWADGSTVSRKLWDSGTGTWGGATTYGDDTAAIQMTAQSNSGAIMAIALEDDTSATDDLVEVNLTTGSQTWSSPAIIWGGPVARNAGYTRMAIASKPAILSSGESSSGTAYSFQRKTWYDGTRYWKAYSTGNNIFFEYSTNGSAWTRNDSATITGGSNDFSIEADSEDIFIAYTDGYDIKINKDNSNYPATGFSWSTSPTIIYDGSSASDEFDYPTVTRDSNNKLWVSVAHHSSSDYLFKTIRSTAANDISAWGTAASLDTSTNSNKYGTIASVGVASSVNMYSVWIDGTAIEGKKYIGVGTTGWAVSSDSIGTGLTGMGNSFSTVSDTNGNVHLTYVDSSGNVEYQKYTDSWQSAVSLDANGGSKYPSISVDTAGGNGLYTFWIRNNDVFYKQSCPSYSSWGDIETLEDAGTNDWLTTSSQDFGSGKIFAAWTSGASSPYAVTWNSITPESCSQPPNLPTSLVQMKTDNTVIPAGSWVNSTSIKVGATASDPDSSDTLFLCIERDLLAVSFSNVEDSCGIGFTYSGTPISLTETVSDLSDNSEYHWQVRIKDSGNTYSDWEVFGGGVTRDFGTDTSAPSAGTVYDGEETGVDINFSNSSLSQLSSNWGGINGDVSGIASYEYSIGSTAGATDVKVWTSIGTGTSATATGLTLQTSQLYFFNVRATDNAGNTQSPAISSNGQQVAPSLNFSVSPSSLTFNSLGVGNSYSDTQDTTLTVSTNAYGGYVVRSFTTDLLRSSGGSNFSIQNFNGGTYSSPGVWGPGNIGFGYTSSDETIQGQNKFSGGDLYAPFSQSGPGDIVADHTDNVAGLPIKNEQFTMTYKVRTSDTQQAAAYTTAVVYTVTAQY